MRYKHLLLLAAACAVPMAARSQNPKFAGPEIRPFIGAYMPSGGMKTQFQSATILGAQAAYEATRHLHVVGTLSWMNARTRLASLDDNATSVWQYDAGLEFNIDKAAGRVWLFQPFLGAGVGGRSYDYQASNVNGSSCTTGYATTGAQLQRNALAWRVEGRGYLACYESPVTGKSRTRNDFSILFGAAWHFR